MKNSSNGILTIAAFGVLIVMGFTMFFSAQDSSPTNDEPVHILSGYAALRFGHVFIDIEHPLLAKSFATFPLLFTDVSVNTDDPDYTTQKEDLNIGRLFDTSRSFLDYETNDPDKIVLWSRIPMIFLTLFFGYILFLFTKQLFGRLAAFFALIFFSSEPFILANGPLVNTDIAGAGFFLTTIFALYLYSKQQSSKRLLFLVVVLAGALLSKFSTFYLFPITIVLMELIFLGKNIQKQRHILFLIGGVFFIITLFYGFISFRSEGFMGFVPDEYFKGLFKIITTVSGEDRFSYLLGNSYTGGRWYYFPTLLFLKTQLLTLVGSILFFIFIWNKKIKMSFFDMAIVIFPPTLFFFLATISSLNIGLRHILPVYPFLILFAGAAFAVVIQKLMKEKKKLLVTSFVSILILGRIISVWLTSPHFLSYFNVLAGGTDNGWRVAGDSNYDWGQDVKRLAQYVSKNNIDTIALDNYSGWHAARDYYHIPLTSISPSDTNYKGYFALSTSVLNYHEDREANYSWVLDNYKPIGRAGKSILIFKIE